MNADAFFMIGKTHSICQDYALAGPHVEGCDPYVLLSDGCSSSPHSDFGSRFLTLAARDILATSDSCDDVFRRATIATAHRYAASMDLPTDCLCATLAAAFFRSGALNLWLSGDGVAAVRERESGRVHVYSYEYPSGAPFYLRYGLDNKSVQAYIDKFGFLLKTSHYHLEADGQYNKVSEWATDNPEDAIIQQGWNADNYDLLVVWSDGVRSFIKTTQTATSKTQVAVPFMDVVKDLLTFKNYSGIFVQRRMKRAFEPGMGLFAKEGWVNADDLAMGAVALV